MNPQIQTYGDEIVTMSTDGQSYVVGYLDDGRRVWVVIPTLAHWAAGEMGRGDTPWADNPLGAADAVDDIANDDEYPGRDTWAEADADAAELWSLTREHLGIPDGQSSGRG